MNDIVGCLTRKLHQFLLFFAEWQKDRFEGDVGVGLPICALLLIIRASRRKRSQSFESILIQLTSQIGCLAACEDHKDFWKNRNWIPLTTWHHPLIHPDLSAKSSNLAPRPCQLCFGSSFSNFSLGFCCNYRGLVCQAWRELFWPSNICVSKTTARASGGGRAKINRTKFLCPDRGMKKTCQARFSNEPNCVKFYKLHVYQVLLRTSAARILVNYRNFYATHKSN